MKKLSSLKIYQIIYTCASPNLKAKSNNLCLRLPYIYVKTKLEFLSAL